MGSEMLVRPVVLLCRRVVLMQLAWYMFGPYRSKRSLVYGGTLGRVTLRTSHSKHMHLSGL